MKSLQVVNSQVSKRQVLGFKALSFQASNFQAANFQAANVSAANVSAAKYTRCWGGIVAGIVLLAPQVTLAQGFIPTLRTGGTRFVELRAGIQRGYRSATAARYSFYLNDPKVTSQRLIITETTNNFAQSGGVFNLKEIQVRSCSNMGNVLTRPKCEKTIPVSEILYCSTPGGCQTYNPDTKAITVDPKPYEGKSYLSIIPKTPIPQKQSFAIIFSDVQNPQIALDYQFNLSIETPRNICAENWRTALGHCAIGTWIVPIEMSNE
jgi:hypothetical protein